MGSVIRAERLSKRFGELEALAPLDLERPSALSGRLAAIMAALAPRVLPINGRRHRAALPSEEAGGRSPHRRRRGSSNATAVRPRDRQPRGSAAARGSGQATALPSLTHSAQATSQSVATPSSG